MTVKKWPALFLIAAALFGAGAWLLSREVLPPPPPETTGAAEDPAQKQAREEEAARMEQQARFSSLLTAAQRAWRTDDDPQRAERLLQEALAEARSDEQRFAAAEWRAELFDGRDDKRQHAAGRAMRAAAHGPRQQAAAFHVMGRASEKTGDYRAALTDYETAANHYREAGLPEMAWLDYAAAARIAFDKLHSGDRANPLWKKAWQTVEASGLNKQSKADAFYSLCLDQAGFAASRKEYEEELRWHREAARWQPSHSADVGALEDAYRRQRKL